MPADLASVRLGRVPDSSVAALYRGCVATVHASWAEGFGLSVRESIVRGIPDAHVVGNSD